MNGAVGCRSRSGGGRGGEGGREGVEGGRGGRGRGRGEGGRGREGEEVDVGRPALKHFPQESTQEQRIENTFPKNQQLKNKE